MNIKKDSSVKKIKIVPKVLVGGMALTLSFVVLMSCVSLYNSQKRVQEFEQNYVAHHSLNYQNLEDFIAYSDNEDRGLDDCELVVDTYLESDWLNYIYIYDMNYLDKVLNYDCVSLDELYTVILNNNLISEKFII